MSSKLCINTCTMFDEPITEILKAVKNAGFDAVFTDWESNLSFDEIYKTAINLGLEYQSLHAPFYGMDDIWHDDEGTLSDKMLKDLYGCINDCARYNIPLMICHAIIGMDNHNPTDLGIERLSPVIDYAESKGVTIAFENTEGEEYLAKIFENFGDRKNVGFCLDTGHEMCYNHSKNLLADYGKYLVSTHLNDNMGITGEKITFYDDCHLLPFDGIADWNIISERLHTCGYNGILTFELNYKSRPTRHENDRYSSLSMQEYLIEAYRRACKFRDIFDKYNKL